MDYTGGALELVYNVYLLGDQTNSYESELTQLLHVKDCEVLSSFLEQAHYALRIEVSRLPISRRRLIPQFTSVIDLVARKPLSPSNPALELALLCLSQLARFIKYYGDGARSFPTPHQAAVLGLCTGSIAAAAISASSSLFELVPFGIEAVLIAFRIGLRSTEVRNDIEHGAESSDWSMIVGMKHGQAKTELDTFSAMRGYPRASRPYLSAIAPTTVTITGPPRALDELVQMPSFAALKPVSLSINAPYHAKHLYTESDVDAIIQASDARIMSLPLKGMPMISCSTGKLVSASNFGLLIKIVAQDILINQLRWDIILSEIGSNIPEIDILSQYNVLPIHHSLSMSQSLASSISQIREIDAATSNDIMEISSAADQVRQSCKASESKIAIVGFSGRYPDAGSNQAFWELLHEGRDVHREIPADRFDPHAHYDPSGKQKNTSRVQYGCFVNEPGLFDARFFSMSPREAANTDPGQRLAITTAYEALEMAGFVPDRTPSSQRNRVGCFYGMTSDDWREVNSGQDIDTYFIPGGNRAFTPGRINYHFKFSGPSYSVDTACSSSFAAIHTACNSLWRGDCDTAVAGGTNILTNPDNFAGLDRGHFLSTTGNCNTFDDDANGYCRADAVGTVILKRLEDAKADRDPIYGVILGAFTNHSAEADSITRPLAAAQSYIFDKMLRSSNVDPLDISYIEMHGTGTQAGDATEMQSVVDTFAKTSRGPQHPLHLGSVKANVGHAESASGVTALIKVLLMMKNNEIPPHCGIKTRINHNFPRDLEARNVNIALKPTTWERSESKKRSVFMNNFSAAGGNTALLMEDAPAVEIVEEVEEQDHRCVHLVAVSAKSVDSLQRNVEALRAMIDGSTSLHALSYTTTARRMHHSFRAIVSGHDLPTIQQGLQDLSASRDVKRIPAKPPNVAFVFTGQGSAYCGMVRDLYRTSSTFKSDIERFDSIARSQGFPSFLPFIDCSELVDSKEFSPIITQVGAACTQMALARLWISWGVGPSTVIGHSLGEYAALNVAGVLSASDTIYLTGARARMLEQRCTAGTHSMLAVKAPLSLVTPHLLSTCEFACINSLNEIVVSGENVDIDALSSLLIALEIRCKKLDIPFAFHSAQVEPILEDFETLAQGVAFDNPVIPFISPLLQGVVTVGEILNPSYLRQACRKTVNFLGGIKSALAAKTVTEKTLWIEIGAHPVCSGMLKSIIGSQITALPSLRRNGDSWKTLAESTASLHQAGFDINWDEYHRDCTSRVLELPSYSWDNKNHWIQYENNFCLTKGDKPVVQSAAPTVSSLSTTSVQRVVEQSLGDDISTLTIESDLFEPDLRGVVEGHVVNGANLCPSSLYADIALIIGDYLAKSHTAGDGDAGMAVTDMVVAKPLIATGIGAQLFRAHASADWRSRRIKIDIYSVDSDGKKTTDHASCTVEYGNKDEWLKEWQRFAYLIRNQIHTLHHTVEEGQSNKMKRGMAYKLFSTLVSYGKGYQGMQEVVLDSAQLEATARVQFQTTEGDGRFYFSPYWIDSLGHLAGFIMNANDGVDSKNTVFVNHGWESMRCAVRLSKDKTYQTYVKMQNVGGTMHAGDVYIFHDGIIQAVYQGVKFQGVPRRALDHLLPATSSPKSGSKSQTANAHATSGLRTGTVTKDNVRTVTEKMPGSTVEKVETIRETIQPSASVDLAHQGLAIVAQEIGLSVTELAPNSDFSDLGVDSLLTLTISSRLREELELDVPASLFVDYPTVQELTTFLHNNEAKTVLSVQSTASRPTPETASEASEYQTETDETDMSSADEENVDIMATIRFVLAEEIGIPANDLKDDSDFGELGLDSLLSLTVLARLREELDIDLPASLLADNNSLTQVKTVLGIKQKPTVVIEETHIPHHKTVSKSVVSSVKEVLPSTPYQTSKPAAAPVPKASSMVLQGSSKHATKVLFLFPDGSGSATSYAPLPPISSDVVVYGLNCPYMMSPQDMKCSLEDLTPSYIAEIRRRQPHGPYYLGGWSAGGISAFDAAQELQRQGEKVAKLILLDSPFPIGLEKLPPRLYDFFSSIGMFGSAEGKAAPPWLIPHFLAFVESLDRYQVKAFAPGTGPETHIMWAKDGVCKNAADPRPEPRADDPREMLWLLNNRTDFGPNGWDGLIGGGDSVVVETLENANHFTLMQGQNAFKLARFVERAML